MKRAQLLREKQKTPVKNTAETSTEFGSKEKLFYKGPDPMTQLTTESFISLI